MTHFHRICYGNCALKYVTGVLVLRKVNFGGLKGQLNVIKANFRGLIVKIGNYRPFLLHRVYFHGVCHRNCALKYVGGILELRKLLFGGQKGQFDVKKASFRGLILKIGHYWPIMATTTHL